MTAASAPVMEHIARVPTRIAARAPAVDFSCCTRSTCARGGARRASPNSVRSTCASGGTHRTSSCGITCSSDGAPRPSSFSDRSTCASGGAHRISSCCTRSTCARGEVGHTSSCRKHITCAVVEAMEHCHHSCPGECSIPLTDTLCWMVLLVLGDC